MTPAPPVTERERQQATDIHECPAVLKSAPGRPRSVSSGKVEKGAAQLYFSAAT